MSLRASDESEESPWLNQDGESEHGLQTRVSIAVRMVLFYLGLSAGALIATYFTSVGFYQKRLSSVRLFGFQALVVLGFQFGTTLTQTKFDEHFDQSFGIAATYGFRIIATGLLGAFLLLLAPILWSEATVLIFGAVISFLATAQASSSSQLGASIAPGNNMFVVAGLRFGGFVPIFAIHLTGFDADASSKQALSFYGVVSAMAIGGSLVFAYCHYMAVGSGAIPDVKNCIRSLSPRSQLQRTYSSLSLPMADTQTNSAESVATDEPWWQIFVSLLYLCTFLPTPLFPLMGPYRAQSLVLAKIVGDALGCLTGISHGTFISAADHFGTSLRMACYIIALMRAVATGYLLSYLAQVKDLEEDIDLTTVWCQLLVFFAVGQHVAAILDVGVQAQRPMAQRKSIARRGLVMQFAGSFSGTLLGLAILHLHHT